MSARTSEEYVEDRAARFPNLTRSELIASERLEMIVHTIVSVAVFGLTTWALAVYASPDWAKGAGFAYGGYLISELVEYFNRIRAFKRLMPEN